MSLADIKRIARNIVNAPAAIRRSAADAARKEIQELLDEQFDEGIGPDGTPWHDLAESTIRRGRFPPPLTDTRAMRDSTKAVCVGTNVTIEADFPAQVHQEGYPGRNLPRRPIWPDESLPERYRMPIEYATTRAIVDSLKKIIK